MLTFSSEALILGAPFCAVCSFGFLIILRLRKKNIQYIYKYISLGCVIEQKPKT